VNYRDLKKGGDLFSALEHQKNVQQRIVGILKLRDLIDWEKFRSLLENILGYDTKDWSKGGAPPFDPVFMFKVLVLQRFHNLSDEATEAQIGDRISFMSFLGLDLGDDYPDQNTIWDFKQSLEQERRNGTQKLFVHFENLLESEGLIAKEGSIVDASFVDAPRQRNTREQNEKIKNGEIPEEFLKSKAKLAQKDCDARWVTKNKERHFGYKNHVKADAKSKLITHYCTSEASLHDSQVFKQLVDEGRRARPR